MILSGPLIQKSRLFYLTVAATAKERIWAAQSGVTFHSGGCIKENAMAVGAAALALEEALQVPAAFGAVSRTG